MGAGEAEPARVLQETLAALREADSVTADGAPGHHAGELGRARPGRREIQRGPAGR
jgi:hypothetical protein